MMKLLLKYEVSSEDSTVEEEKETSEDDSNVTLPPISEIFSNLNSIRNYLQVHISILSK